MNSKRLLILSLILLVLLALSGLLLWNIQQMRQALVPRTWLADFRQSDGTPAKMLATTRVYGSDRNGLPNSSDTYTIPSTMMAMQDIYVIEEDGEVSLFIKGIDGEFWAFPPAELADQAIRGSRRILYFRDGVLVAGSVQYPEQPLEEQIQSVMDLAGGSIYPLLFMDGTIWTPGYCYDPTNLASCRFRGVRATADNVAGFTPGDDFQFMVLDHVPANETTEYSRLYVPMSSVEAFAFQHCLEQINPDASPGEVCEV